MKKNFVCIFAHPDDEAFGPSGTIHKLTRDYNVYILCATKGQVGKDSDFTNGEKLHSRRAHELLDSAKILGVKEVFFLGFKDGALCNSSYHKLASKIEDYLKKLKPEGLMTFEPRGVSGHIDHITVSMVTTYVFQKLPFIKKLMYYCLDSGESEKYPDYFIYFPEGYDRENVDEVMDVSDVWETKLAAMLTHKSQKHDCDRILKNKKGRPKEEYFLVKKK